MASQTYWIDSQSNPKYVLIKDNKGNVLMSLHKGLDIESILNEFRKDIKLKEVIKK